VRRHAKASSTGSIQGQVIGFATLAILFLCAFLTPSSAPAAGDANRASCPLATESSPGFRSYLPDCRAYEMVTPPFMGGFPPILTSVPPPRGSEYDSGSILFSSFGTFADAPGASISAALQTLYQANRTIDGWRTFSPMPPIRFDTQFPGNGPKVAVIPSADNSALMWRMRDTTEAGSHTSIYLRRGNGPFEVVGPITDEPGPTPKTGEEALLLIEYAAADLSRIPLRALVPSGGVDPWLWPGDTTLEEEGTLYEYDLSEPGIGLPTSEPKLVGVKNEGRLASNTEAELISECGVVLGGGGSFQAANRIDRSISEDGKYLFFTAERGCASTVQPLIKELFARIDGEETIAISNPPPSDCTACLNETTTPTRAAAIAKAKALQVFFQGASKDGTKVFFTSFQELFPGIFGTGAQPHLYRYDFEAPAGEKLELVSKVAAGSAEMTNPPAKYTGVSADGERAYFVAKKVLASNESAAYDPETEANQVAVQGKFNLYGWEASKDGEPAQIKFIAQLPAGNLNPIATPDGRFIVFSSTAQLVESNTSTVEQLFEYDAVSGALVRVSVGDQGYNDNGNTSVNAPEKPFVSADGRRVFFVSSKALAPGAFDDPTNTSNSFKNIYEWTWSGEAPSEAEARVFPILSAPAENGALKANISVLEGIDPTGDNVYFLTTGKLVPQHTGGQRALYTARVDGGFPGLAEEPSCEADACQGLPTAAPGGTSLASAALSGPGNAKQRRRANRRCAKGARKAGKARSKARCAPKRGKRDRRTTKTNRGAGR